MTLPLSRDFDAVDSGPLPHTTVNNVQDMIVGGRHGSIRRIVPASFGETAGGTTGTSFTSVTVSPGGTYVVPLDLRAGQTIEDLFVESFSLNAGDKLDFQLYKTDVAVAGTVGATGLGAGANRDAVPGIASIVTVLGDFYVLLLAAPGGNTFAITLHGIDYDITG